MKIGIYNPYLEIGLGGGERYVLALASHWSKKHNVEIYSDRKDIIEASSKIFKIDISNTKITRNYFRGNLLLKKLYLTRQYDLIFFLTDGSIPSSLARYNILHFQVPFQKLHLNPIKMSRFSAIVCNSQFTKDHLPSNISSFATVIYPPVDFENLETEKKEKILLSVGRFSTYHHVKKQEILLKAFSLFNKRIEGFRFIFAGGLIPTDRKYLESLKSQARGLPIEFMPNISYSRLRQLYGKAMIYWHAAGYEETNPENMEHFGISTVEAMASGAVPIVFNAGGQPEIIINGKNGFLWNSLTELIEKTIVLVNEPSVFDSLSLATKISSKRFDRQVFNDQFDSLLEKICY